MLTRCALVALASALCAQDAPPNLMKRIAAVETAAQEAQSNYTYRQSVTMDEIDGRGAMAGTYRELRDIIFSPSGERTEQFVGKPRMELKHLKLTDEDFRDIREIQPFLLTNDQAFIYELKFRGEENMDGVDCYVVQIRPRQILDKQRLFDGNLWVDKSDFSVVRSEGQAVPQIVTTKSENLFPHFTTLRQKVDGQYRFPVTTYADDTLYFRTGAQRVRLTIRYSEYKKFGSDSKITFHEVP
ncbi:MAG: hypothetical protein ABSH09_26855 [Bryobacteraceae bacterium]